MTIARLYLKASKFYHIDTCPPTFISALSMTATNWGSLDVGQEINGERKDAVNILWSLIQP